MKIAYIRPRFSAWLVLMALSCPMKEAKAEEGDTPKWGPHLDLEGKAGTNRNLGEVDLFMPLLQNEDTLFFTNLRTRMDDGSSVEGNFGVGLRHMLDSGWNVGGIAYFDRRKSEWDNYYNQVTLGLEALSTDWDFRANAYVPVGRDSYDVDSLNTASISGTTVIFRGGEERSMGGFDAEIGWRAPIFDEDAGQQLRLYGGGYRFSDDKAGLVAGPRGRIDLTFDEVPFLWQGSRFSLGAEIQHDDPRGTQSFASFRLRIPFQVFSDHKPLRQNLNPIEKRMTDPVIRDIDVVTQSGTYGPTEIVSSTASGGALSIVDSSSTTGANLATAIASAGANSTVVLQGSFTNVSSKVQLQAGQTLMGSGTLRVKSPSGRTATIQTGSASISGSGTVETSIAKLIEMANNSSLVGITASNPGNGTNGSFAVTLDGVSGVTIKDSTLSATATDNTAAPIYIINSSSDITITGNTLSATGAVGNEAVGGFVAISSSNITFSNNSVSATGGNNNSLWLINATGLSGSGNTRNGETCKIQGTNTGSISFTDNTTCP